MLPAMEGWPGVKSPGDVVWSHATNRKHLLDEALGAETLHMIEVNFHIRGTGSDLPATQGRHSHGDSDRWLGKLQLVLTVSLRHPITSQEARVPIMGHPPDEKSDLSFDSFVKQIVPPPLLVSSHELSSR